MNKERIQINGEWYVKENTIEPLINPEDVTHSIECVWEDTNWCFVASLIVKEDDFNDCYDDVYLKITGFTLGLRSGIHLNLLKNKSFKLIS